MTQSNGTKPAAEQVAEVDAQGAPSEEQELERLQLLQNIRRQERLHAAQREIAAICQKHRVQLVAQPQFTPDGRVVAPVAIIPVDQ